MMILIIPTFTALAIWFAYVVAEELTEGVQ